MHEREMGEDWYRDDRFIIVKRKKAPKPTPPAGLLPLTHSIYLCFLFCKIHCVAWDDSCHGAYFVLLRSFPKLLFLSLCRGLLVFLKLHGALQVPSTLFCLFLPELQRCIYAIRCAVLASGDVPGHRHEQQTQTLNVRLQTRSLCKLFKSLKVRWWSG